MCLVQCLPCRASQRSLLLVVNNQVYVHEIPVQNKIQINKQLCTLHCTYWYTRSAHFNDNNTRKIQHAAMFYLYSFYVHR